MSNGEPGELLKDWQKSVRIWHMAHSRAATRYDTRGRFLGLLVVLCSAIVGTSLIADLTSTIGVAWKYVGIFLSAAATVLAAIQTYMNYSEKAEKHRQIAQKYGSLRRDLEQEIEISPSDIDKYCAEIRKRWDVIEEEAPNIPQTIYNRARIDVDLRIRQKEASIEHPHL